MIKKLFVSQLRINMLSGVVTTVVNGVFLAIAYPIYLHFLGYERYGIWLVLATVLSFAQIGNLGIGQAVIKMVAEEYGRNDINGIQSYVTTALALLCLSGTIALIVILALKNQIIAAFKLSGENAKIVSWLLPYIGILSIYVFIVQVLNATVSGLGRMDLANWTQSLGRIVAVTTTSYLLYTGQGIKSLLIGNTISYVFIHIVSLLFIGRVAQLRFLKIHNLDYKRGKHLLRFGGAVFGGKVVGMMFIPFNRLMLSRYAGVSAIPIFDIAYQASMYSRGSVGAAFKALIPETGRISANMTGVAKNRIFRINRSALKLILFLGVPVFGIAILLAEPVLKFWFRQSFVVELPVVFRIMLVGTFFSLLGMPAYFILLGLGKARYCFWANVIQTSVSIAIILTIVLLRGTLTVYSVAYASLIAMVMLGVYLIFQNYRTLKFIEV